MSSHDQHISATPRELRARILDLEAEVKRLRERLNAETDEAARDAEGWAREVDRLRSLTEAVADERNQALAEVKRLREKDERVGLGVTRVAFRRQAIELEESRAEIERLRERIDSVIAWCQEQHDYCRPAHLATAPCEVVDERRGPCAAYGAVVYDLVIARLRRIDSCDG